jgi:beta-lactamase regulating signal transducer with metallopeptidase domain
MNWLQTIAQMSVERILNALPEGLLIAFFAWVLLRVLRRQNSGTRFAVWFLALLAVVTLPILATLSRGRAFTLATVGSSSLHPAITIPSRWAVVFFLTWMSGAGLAMIRLGAGLFRLRQLHQSCVPVDVGDLDPMLRKTVEAIGASASGKFGSSASDSITISTSEAVRVPAAIGFWKRTIVLPAWALRELPAEDLNVILLHEFAHLQRGDEWTNLIQKLVRGLFFFHPAVWWIEKQLSVEREMACDDAVLAQTANPRGYAACLVSLLEKSVAHRMSQQPWSMAQAAVHRAREAALRLARILDTNRPAATRVWSPALGMVSAFSIVCLMVLPLSPQLVGFDRGTATNPGSEYSAARTIASRPSSFAGASLVPASFRTAESLSLPISTKTTNRPVASHHKLNRSPSMAEKPIMTDISNIPQPPAGLVEASVIDEPGIEPQFQTLVFVEATQYGNDNSQLWTVQVWRVTFVSAMSERIARVPVASSI